MRAMLLVVGILAINSFFVEPAMAQRFGTAVPMSARDAATYYVRGEIAGIGSVDFMVDTGSGYTTINEDTLRLLLLREQARYVNNLEAILADGQRLQVPVYSLRSVTIGDRCRIENVEAAVFPGKTRLILGLSALRKAGPIIFSFDPPELVLSDCAASS